MSQERPIRLHAGPWSLEFERWSGWLRAVRLGGEEVLRNVYESVRGPDWRTYRFYSATHRVAQEEGSFEVHWNLECDDLNVTWEGSCKCDGKVLDISLEGTIGEDFSTRRVGLCVLQPREMQGKPCKIIHPDGQEDTGAFPVEIDPSSPFTEIKAMKYPAGNAEVLVEFEGEIFETEDQRNWSDASYKTYCRPQNRPQPYELTAGTKVRHSARLTFTGTPSEYVCEPTTKLLLTSEWRPLPHLGTRGKREDERFDFILVHDQERNAWTTIGVDLNVTFALDRGALEFLSGPIFYGPNDDFVGLNRNRPNMANFDGVAYGVTPQIHTFDDRSIMENLHSQPDVLHTAKKISEGKPVFVGPILFRRDHNEEDIRLEDPIAAAWFLTSFANLAQGGAFAVSYFDDHVFRDTLGEALKLLREFKGGEISLMSTSNLYRAAGFRLRNELGHKDCLINLTPFTEEVSFEGNRYTLDPFEFRQIA